jgi:hypothetical protein
MKRNPNLKCYSAKEDSVFWKYETVKKVIQDESYTGKFISGRVVKHGLGSNQSKAMPKDTWRVYEGVIPAIITGDEFTKAQAVMKPKSAKTPGFNAPSLFARKLSCGHCGYALHRMKQDTYGCIAHKYSGREKCFAGTVNTEWLKSKVLEAYRDAVGVKALTAQQEQRHETDLDGMKARLKKQRQSAQRLKDAKKALFEQFSSGLADADGYKAQNAEITRQLRETEQGAAELEAAIEQSKRKPQAQTPDAEMVEFSDSMMAFVKGIKVFSTIEAVVEIDLSGVGSRS